MENNEDRGYVNVYLVDKAYGGPEEGGWYYDYGVVVGSMPYSALSFRAAQAYCDEANQGRPPITDTNSVGRYCVHIEDEQGTNFPDRKPFYE